MSKENNKIEVLLNKIYNEVDLKGDIFEFAQPFILNAYALLRHDESAKEEGKIDEILFKDFEKKLTLENILYRDFPGIIDLYAKTPIEYRNEKILKENKTYRDLLIENIEVLCKKLKSLENEAYSQFDISMKVSNRVIKDKYAQEDFLNLSKDSLQTSNVQYKIEDKFDWNSVKEQTDKIFIKTDKYNINDRNNIGDDNKKIVLTENKIEYKVRDKHRHFMNGVYDAYGRFKNQMDKMKTSTEDNFNNFTHGVKRKIKHNKLEIVGITILACFIGTPSYFLGDTIFHTIQSSPAKQLEKIKEILGTNSELREFSLLALDKYVKEENLKTEAITSDPEQEGQYISRKISSSKCIHSVQYIKKEYNYASTEMNYYINNNLIHSSKPLPDNVIEELCALPVNEIGIAVGTKPKIKK